MANDKIGEFSIDRMFRAIELVHESLWRTVAAMKTHGVPYAICRGGAAAEWMERADQGGVRFADDVDVLLRRNVVADTGQWN